MRESTELDPRVRRTRRALEEAMLALAEERSFAAITVRDITRRADVNRATFYLHYRDKDDLVAQVLDALFDEVTAEDRAFTEAHGRLTAEIVPPPLVALFRHIAERPRLYHSLLSGDGSSVFAARLRAFHETQFLRLWEEMRHPLAAGGPPPALQARYAAAAVQGVISWWLDGDRRESPETMATWLWGLLLPLWFAPPATDLQALPTTKAAISRKTSSGRSR